MGRSNTLFRCVQDQQGKVHVFLEKFCLAILRAGMIVSVVWSSHMVEVGSSLMGDTCELQA